MKIMNKNCLGVYEHYPLVTMYLKGNNKIVNFSEDPESEEIFTVHKDYLPAMAAKIKEVIGNDK